MARFIGDSSVDMFLQPAEASASPARPFDRASVRVTGAAAVSLFCIVVLLLTGALGCMDQTSLIPNSDPSLRKTKDEFAADASTRQPYHADAPRGGKLPGRAIADYEQNTIQIANFSQDDWTNVEVWVNGQWVVYVPKVEGRAETCKTIDFTMMYNRLGHAFPSENLTPDTMVQKIEVFKDGKLYDLAAVPAD